MLLTWCIWCLSAFTFPSHFLSYPPASPLLYLITPPHVVIVALFLLCLVSFPFTETHSFIPTYWLRDIDEADIKWIPHFLILIVHTFVFYLWWPKFKHTRNNQFYCQALCICAHLAGSHCIIKKAYHNLSCFDWTIESICSTKYGFSNKPLSR